MLSSKYIGTYTFFFFFLQVQSLTEKTFATEYRVSKMQQRLRAPFL